MFIIVLFAVCAGVHTLSVLAAHHPSSGLLYHHQYQKVQYSHGPKSYKDTKP
jgi:hypothetical protein